MDIRLQNDTLARILHESLYKRIVAFCEQYTPEFFAEPIASAWLNRLYSDDNNLHILVSLDDNYAITSHCIIDVQNVHGYNVVHCYQAQSNKDHSGMLDKVMEYIDKLAITVNARCSLTFVDYKRAKSLEKKYNCKIARAVLVKYNDEAI